MAKNTYTAKDITVLEGLEPVRLRPGMYIGSTGPRGLHHLVYEVVDNSVDEALAGRNDRIEVTLHPDNSVTVRDFGSGIPVDIMADQGRPAPRVVRQVTRNAAQTLKQLFTGAGHRYGSGAAAEPGLKLSRLHDDDPADHAGMLRAAILRAK